MLSKLFENFHNYILTEDMKRLSEAFSVEEHLSKFRKLISQYNNAKAFDSAALKGFGALSAGEIVAYISKHSRTHLNINKVRDAVRNINWFFLYKVNLSNINFNKVVPTGKENLTIPIVVDKQGNVLDGNHRVNLALQRGSKTLPAYIPATTLYKEIREEERKRISIRNKVKLVDKSKK